MAKQALLATIRDRYRAGVKRGGNNLVSCLTGH